MRLTSMCTIYEGIGKNKENESEVKRIQNSVLGYNLDAMDFFSYCANVGAHVRVQSMLSQTGTLMN